MDAVKLRLGLQTVMLLSQRGNLYLQSSGLNKALMNENPTRCAQVVTRAANLIYMLSALVYPFMPSTSASILVQLNAPARSVPEALSIDILPGHHIGRPEHLFKKIEEKMADVWRAKFAGSNAAASAAAVTGETQATSGMSKRKAAAAKKSAQNAVREVGEADRPQPAEVVALDTRIVEQGKLVRELKARTPRTKELDEEIAVAVTELKKLKAERAALSN
jgi:methionyl-tRNA synthetase